MSEKSEKKEIDLYETLQISPRADQETIERVFRHLAKRFHPDNGTSGDAERFGEIMEAYRTLADPERRAAYDARYEEVQRQHWEIFDQASSASDVETDRRIRVGVLTVLYQARRRDVRNPGVGILDLERILDTPSDHMEFHLWYLKEKGWVERMDTGLLAITVDGVEHLHEEDIPWAGDDRLLTKGLEASETREAGPATEGPEAGRPEAASSRDRTVG